MLPFVVDKGQCVARDPFPGVRMYAAEARTMTVSIVELQPGAEIPEHSHPHEQVGYSVAGEFEFVIDGKSHRVTPGQVWRIPGGTPHRVVAGSEGATAVDVFYPIREDMRG